MNLKKILATAIGIPLAFAICEARPANASYNQNISRGNYVLSSSGKLDAETALSAYCLFQLFRRDQKRK